MFRTLEAVKLIAVGTSFGDAPDHSEKTPDPCKGQTKRRCDPFQGQVFFFRLIRGRRKSSLQLTAIKYILEMLPKNPSWYRYSTPGED